MADQDKADESVHSPAKLGDATVYYAIHEGRLFITNRPERISAVLGNLAETPDKSLATAPTYRSGALDSGKGTTVFAYADMPRQTCYSFL